MDNVESIYRKSNKNLFYSVILVFLVLPLATDTYGGSMDTYTFIISFFFLSRRSVGLLTSYNKIWCAEFCCWWFINRPVYNLMYFSFFYVRSFVFTCNTPKIRYLFKLQEIEDVEIKNVRTLALPLNTILSECNKLWDAVEYNEECATLCAHKRQLKNWKSWTHTRASRN